jgi:hypothetical protein
MGTEGVDRQQQRVSEFLRLLPLTIEIAGLPRAEPGKYFTEGQMDVRVNALRTAYKLARQTVIEVAK